MHVCFASEGAPGHANEDLVIASDRWCVVLDGATEALDVDSGCRHGVVWYVSQLGAFLSYFLTRSPSDGLVDILGQSIASVSGLHSSTCDLSNPDSPSSVVAILRERSEEMDYLVLCDSVIILESTDGGLQIVVDDRTARLPSYTVEAVRELRNSENGFWVASTLPEAAMHSLSGSAARPLLQSAVLLTDGASRLVNSFGWSWRHAVDLAKRAGPSELIREVRIAEGATASRKGKRHDDATVALVTYDASPQCGHRSPAGGEIAEP